MPFLVTDNGSGEVIKTAYERLFLAFYGWSLKTDGDKGAYNVYYATLMLSLGLLLNLAGIALLADRLVPHPFLPYVMQLSKIWWMIFMVAFAAIQYLYFSQGNRYRKLVAAYGQSKEGLRDGAHVKVLGYLAASFVLVVVLLFV